MAADGDGSTPGRAVVLGLLADPGAPVATARQLAAELPEVLSRRVSDEVSWRVDVVCERLAADEQGDIDVAAVARDQKSRQRYDAVICLTDQPRRAGLRPIVAEVNAADGTALASVPALGLLRLRRRAREMVVRLVTELVGERLGLARDGKGHAARRLSRITAPIRRVAPTDGGHEVRFLSAEGRGHLRLLAGMVRANRPWRLVPALSTAFAGALATGAYGLVNMNIWRIADALGPLRLTGAAVFAVAATVTWLIVDHDLWERPSGQVARRRAVLYNTATVLTVVLGVLCLYVGLFVLSLLAGGLVLDGSLVRRELEHPAGWTGYATIAWMVSSMATVGGALGSGLASDEAVREAAYGYRQKQRRTGGDREQARRDDE